jgi:hypothetical protein
MNIQLRYSSRPGISYKLQQLMHDLKTRCMQNCRLGFFFWIRFWFEVNEILLEIC